MKKNNILTLSLVSIAFLFAGTLVVNAEDASSQDVGLNLKPTITTGTETKTEESDDLTKIWNVTFSTDNLVWNVNQNKDGGSYYYEWDADHGVYNKITVTPASSTATTTLADGESVSRTITITNKSNFDVTPSIAIANGSYVNGLFTASYSGGTLAYGINADANITIDEEKLETIDTLLSESGITDTITVGNAPAYLAGTATISLSSGDIYPAEVIYNGTTSEEFLAAAETVNPGQTLKLNNSVTFDENYSVAVWEKAFNLDLNGNTITTNSGVDKDLSNMGYKASAITYSAEGDITISNGTIRTAYGAGIYLDTINATLSNLNITSNTVGVQPTVEYSSAVRLTSAASATINSGTYTGKNAIAISNSGGDVVINGGTFNGDLFFSKNTNAGVSKSLTINGGTFDGNFVNFDKGTVTINGGTFTSDPTNYIGSGCHVTDNGNGTYTVTK